MNVSEKGEACLLFNIDDLKNIFAYCPSIPQPCSNVGNAYICLFRIKTMYNLEGHVGNLGFWLGTPSKHLHLL